MIHCGVSLSKQQTVGLLSCMAHRMVCHCLLPHECNRDGTLHTYTHFHIISTLFTYFLVCHPYIFFTFLMFVVSCYINEKLKTAKNYVYSHSLYYCTSYTRFTLLKTHLRVLRFNLSSGLLCLLWVAPLQVLDYMRECRCG